MDDLDEIGLDEAGEVVSGGRSPSALNSSAPGQRPVTPLWVIGTFLALVGLAGATALLLKPRGEVLDPSQTEARLFAAVDSDSELALELTEARRLPSGETMLVYRGPESDVSPSGAPLSLTFMEYPVERAKSVLEDQFQKLRFESDSGSGRGRGRGRGRGGRGRRGGGPPQDDDDDGDSKEPKLQDAGFLDWQGYSANYARLRHPISAPSGDGEGGDKGQVAFYESVRVNLSVGGRCLVAYLRFPEGEVASKDAAERVIAAFQPVD